MTKFCPYCGKQLSDRSKFCPQCGKARPARQTATLGVAVDESSPRSGSLHSADSARLQRNFERASTIDARPAGRPEQRTVSLPARPNGSARPALKRSAPQTRAIIASAEEAGFGLRYGAWMFDFLVTLIAIMVFTFAVTAISHRSVVGSNTDLLVVAGLTVLLLILNFVVLAGIGGQTAGMRILGIYIVRIDGSPFTMKQAALRHLIGYPLSSAAFFLGFLWMLWDPRQQGWHDKLVRTIVVTSR